MLTVELNRQINAGYLIYCGIVFCGLGNGLRFLNPASNSKANFASILQSDLGMPHLFATSIIPFMSIFHLDRHTSPSTPLGIVFKYLHYNTLAKGKIFWGGALVEARKRFGMF